MKKHLESEHFKCTSACWSVPREILNKVIPGVRMLEECTHYKHSKIKSNIHTSKNNTHVTVGSIIIKYINRLSVHYPLPIFYVYKKNKWACFVMFALLSSIQYTYVIIMCKYCILSDN